MHPNVSLLDRSVDRRVLAVPVDGMVKVGERTADVAGSPIAYRFSSALAELATALLVEHEIGLALEPENHWIDLIGGVRIGAVAMHPGEPVLGDGAVDRAAATLVDLFAPIVEAVRSMAPFGRAGMWGTLADHLAAHAVGHDRRLGRDGTQGWMIGTALIDRVSVRQPWLRGRPRHLDVNGVVLVEKGACYLIYKADNRCEEDPRSQITAHAAPRARCETPPIGSTA